MALGAIMLGNVVVAVVMDAREVGFKLVPMWIILTSLCLVAKNMALIAVVLGMALCAASEWVCYFNAPEAIKYQQIPPVLVADAILLVIVVLLAATKLENHSSRREMEFRAFRKNQAEQIDLVEKIKKKQLEVKQQGGSAGARAKDEGTDVRRTTLEMQKATYIEVLNLKYRREVPRMLENLFRSWFKMGAGIVFEIGDDARDLKPRGHWGVLEGRPDATAQISAFKDNPVVRLACDRRDPITPEELRKEMTLFEGLEKFNAGLFPLHVAVPITVQDRATFVLLAGAPAQDAALPYEYKTVQPILAALSMSLVKIATKDTRPSFSTFQPGA
jgi:hypothetical protein